MGHTCLIFYLIFDTHVWYFQNSAKVRNCRIAHNYRVPQTIPNPAMEILSYKQAFTWASSCGSQIRSVSLLRIHLYKAHQEVFGTYTYYIFFQIWIWFVLRWPLLEGSWCAPDSDLMLQIPYLWGVLWPYGIRLSSAVTDQSSVGLGFDGASLVLESRCIFCALAMIQAFILPGSAAPTCAENQTFLLNVIMWILPNEGKHFFLPKN